MPISPDLLSAAASIISSVVVIFTALAAFRQIAHMRSANEIQAFSAIVGRWTIPETAESRNFVLTSDALIRDPDFLDELVAPHPSERASRVFPILTLFEEIGTLVSLGIISERAIMINYAPTILRVWRNAEPAIRALRIQQLGKTYRMFEHLAARADRWVKHDEPRLTRRLESMPDSTLLPR
jgi:hypothetical protein